MVLLLAVMLSACQTGSRTALETQPASLAQEEAAIRATDAQWLAAVKSRDVEKTISFWSDDAIILPPGTPPVVGKKAIRDYVAGAFASPEFSIIWELDKVVVASSGDMAYATGNDVITYKGADGKRVSMNARAVVVWRKQADNSWKAAVDIWNAGK
ncbi:MAG: SgcJ/EcaC family oxidoreductase [Terriglobales bacterium]